MRFRSAAWNTLNDCIEFHISRTPRLHVGKFIVKTHAFASTDESEFIDSAAAFERPTAHGDLGCSPFAWESWIREPTIAQYVDSGYLYAKWSCQHAEHVLPRYPEVAAASLGRGVCPSFVYRSIWRP